MNPFSFSFLSLSPTHVLCSGCRSGFSGTSASAPLVAGVIALALSTNPNLSARDVQHLIVSSSKLDGLQVSDAITNKAGLKHSLAFGFGLVNATKLVELAKDWKSVSKEVHYAQGKIVVKKTIPENTSETFTALVSRRIKIEWVEVSVNLKVSHRNDVNISLISPSGVVSPFFSPHRDNNADIVWKFTSCRHWGENSDGFWKLQMSSSHKMTLNDCMSSKPFDFFFFLS